MSATPLDSLLLATANQPGLLTPVTRSEDARGDDFEDHLRDANRVNKTENQRSEREPEKTEKTSDATKSISERQTERSEASVEESAEFETQHSNLQPSDKPSETGEESSQPDHEDAAITATVPGEFERTTPPANEFEVAIGEDASSEDAVEEGTVEEGTAEEGTVNKGAISEGVVDREAADKTIAPEKSDDYEPNQEEPATAKIAEPNLELFDQESKGASPQIPTTEGEPTAVGNPKILSDTVPVVVTSVNSEGQPIGIDDTPPSQITATLPTPDSDVARIVEETARPNAETIQSPTQNQIEKAPAPTTAIHSQSETLPVDTSTDQDPPQQDRSPKKSFGNSQLPEPIADKLEQSLTTAKSEVLKVTADNIAQVDAPPAEPFTDAATAPTAKGRSEGVLGGVLGKLQQTSGRAVQPSSENGPSNQPRVDSARFVGRVTRAFQIAQDRGGTIQLRLSPPELGSLKLQVAIEQGVLSATIDAETDAARNALLDNLPALRARLAEQDIRIDKFDVNVGREGDEAPQEFEMQERQQRENNSTRSTSRRENQLVDERTNESIDITEITAGDNNINLLI